MLAGIPVNNEYTKKENMKIEHMIMDLESSSSCNETLVLLSQIISNTDPRLVQCLAKTIQKPEEIEDTNRFATLLDDLSQPDFIPPLIEAIYRGKPSETEWLADYMYVLGSLLEDQDDWWQPEEKFVHLLGDWLFSTGGGEISWKSAIILEELEHPATLEYFLKGAEAQELMHLTRVCCIRGVMNHFREQAPELLQKLANDPDQNVRDAVASAKEWLSREA